MIVACVRTGDKYSPDYVYRLKAAVARHLPVQHRFVCITDNPDAVTGIETVKESSLLRWWAKLRLFDPSWRGDERVVYFDLDSVICGDISPLAEISVPFGICKNFSLIAYGKYPCRYGSAVMTIAPTYGSDLWAWFNKYLIHLTNLGGVFGDQLIIEKFDPDAALLQPLLPAGFFLGHRDLPSFQEGPPPGCSVVVFAGEHKPGNTNCEWARQLWLA